MTMELQELNDIKKAVAKLASGVEEIRKAILGDGSNDVGSDLGYKKRLESVELRVDKVEDFITKWKWILAGAIGLGGYGSLTFIQQVIEILGKTINKH
jgi:hypothetical protein